MKMYAIKGLNFRLIVINAALSLLKSFGAMKVTLETQHNFSLSYLSEEINCNQQQFLNIISFY